LLQGGKTLARVMTKAIEDLQPLLRVRKACGLAIKIVLGELLETGEHLRKRLVRIHEYRPFAVTQNKVVRRLMAGGLALPGPQSAKEGF
jgi:hypothetical protein